MEEFNIPNHLTFLKQFHPDNLSLAFLKASPLQIGGAYWTVAAQDILDDCSIQLTNDEYRQSVLHFVQSCWDARAGGYAFDVYHDADITATLYAILIHVILNAVEALDKEKIAKRIESLQSSDGSFKSNDYGEVDARFVFCALCALSLINKQDIINEQKAINWIQRCENLDGAFGPIPGSESHAAYTFCCVSALALMNQLDLVDSEKLGRWLTERQISGNCGGFNGRPEKAPDVCYSWWILATLQIIDRPQWISKTSLINYILSCQDSVSGGIADQPGNYPDVFHTFFGTAALSLLTDDYKIKKVHPIYGISTELIQRLQAKIDNEI